MEYQGSELELFADARNWKRYWSAAVREHVRGDLLEVGSGIGSNIEFLAPWVATYTALEPDAALASQIRSVPDLDLRVVEGVLGEQRFDRAFDTVIYVDVLEHIEDDVAEFRRAIEHLRIGGKLVVLAPAHNFLRSPFDDAVGHFRRYSISSLDELARQEPRCKSVSLRYLDSAGLLASLANRFIRKARMPTAPEIQLWDSTLVRLSHLTDPLTAYRLGKSVIGAWERVA